MALEPGQDASNKKEEPTSWYDSWLPPDENTDRGYYPQPDPATTPATPGQPTQADWDSGPVNVPAPQRGDYPKGYQPLGNAYNLTRSLAMVEASTYRLGMAILDQPPASRSAKASVPAWVALVAQ